MMFTPKIFSQVLQQSQRCSSGHRCCCSWFGHPKCPACYPLSNSTHSRGHCLRLFFAVTSLFKCILSKLLPSFSFYQGYIHRSGRTARAQQEGLTVLLIEPSEVNTFSRLFRTLGRGMWSSDFFCLT